jgi:CRP-like cAMP-binding protein
VKHQFLTDKDTGEHVSLRDCPAVSAGLTNVHPWRRCCAEGELFGEGLFKNEARRPSSATAETKCTLLMLRTEGLHK